MSPEFGKIYWLMSSSVITINSGSNFDQGFKTLYMAFTGCLMHRCDIIIICAGINFITITQDKNFYFWSTNSDLFPACNTYMEGSAPLSRRYSKHWNDLFPVWLLITRWIGLQPVVEAKLTSTFNLSIRSFKHSSRPWIEAKWRGVKPWKSNIIVNILFVVYLWQSRILQRGGSVGRAVDW